MLWLIPVCLGAGSYINGLRSQTGKGWICLGLAVYSLLIIGAFASTAPYQTAAGQPRQIVSYLSALPNGPISEISATPIGNELDQQDNVKLNPPFVVDYSSAEGTRSVQTWRFSRTGLQQWLYWPWQSGDSRPALLHLLPQDKGKVRFQAP